MCWCTPEIRTPFCGSVMCNAAEGKTVEPITETVTITRPVDPRIADLVRFAQCLAKTRSSLVAALPQDELVEAANGFWSQQHGLTMCNMQHRSPPAAPPPLRGADIEPRK